MAYPYTRIQNAHRPSPQIFTAKSVALPKKVNTNTSSRIASALIRYNRNQLSFSEAPARERLASGSQPVLKINKIYGGAREMERPKTTSYTSRKLRPINQAPPLSADCPSSPNSTGLVVTKYPPIHSSGQTSGEKQKQPVIKMRKKGDIDVKLEITTKVPESPGTKNLILFIYEHILKDKPMYLNQLNASKLFRGVTFRDMRHGSIILTANCVSLGDLSALEEKYSTGELAEVLSKTILTRRLYSAVGYQGPGLHMVVNIEEADIEVCKKGLRILSRSLKLHGLDGGTFVSRTDCVKEVSHLADKLTSLQVTLNGDYNTFLHNSGDFFTVLKLTKPVQMTSFTTLAEVQWCDSYIKNSPSVGKELNTKPVHDFLHLVQYIQTEVEYISKEFKRWTPSFLKYVDASCVESFKHSVDHMKMLLHPDVKFTDLDFTISMPMTVMERQLFADLVRYMPALQTAIYNMGDLMDELKDNISMNSTLKSTENKTPRTPTIQNLGPVVDITGTRVQTSAETDRFQTVISESCEDVRTRQPKAVSSSQTQVRYAAVVPSVTIENDGFGEENAEGLTLDEEYLDLKSPSLTSETIEHQFKVTIAYKPKIVPHQKHAESTETFLSVRKPSQGTGKAREHEKVHFPARRKTTEMARKLELALSQKRRFEYESVSNISHLLQK